MVAATIVALALAAALDGGLAFARVSARHAAEHYAEVGLAQARAALVGEIAAQVQAGSTRLAAPAPFTSTPGLFAISATFTLGGSTALGGTGTNAVAADLQTHPAIAEQRIAATIVERVTASDGTPLATRTAYVTLRTLSVPPFAIVEGISDAAGAREVASQADAAGCDPTQPATCDASGLTAAHSAAPLATMDPQDTRIRALSQCIDGGTGACAGVRYVSADPTNTPSATPWYNVGAQGNGWSR
jgi:hypothetical protein